MRQRVDPNNTLMRRLERLFTLLLIAGAIALTSSACRREEARTGGRKLEFDSFIPVYNRHIRQWLLTRQAETEKELHRVEAELKSADETTGERLRSHQKALETDREKWAFRLSLGDYLKISDPSAIPAGLTWESGMDEPEIGDPAATKGGVFRKFIPSFPPTIRPFGENSNNSFRSELYDCINLRLVSLHPDTMKIIPGIAREWAVSPDGRTVYFRLDPEARYSDGKPVRARDYLLSIYLEVSDHIVNPYSKQFYREERAQVAMYDDSTLSISLPQARVFAPAAAGDIYPCPHDFYQEYGPDYSSHYQWKFPPTTGAYEVLPQDIVKGASITQTRVKDWWARDRKYYRHRFNADKIIHTVVRDESKAFELFRAGQLETFYVSRPQLWYDKCEMTPVHKGWIERATFFRQYPKSPFGLYANVTKPPLNDLNTRIGIQHALNWEKVIAVLFRGDYQRLNAFNEGYAGFSDPSIRARPYSIELSRKAFRDAGYTGEGRDGILKKPDGTRLSVAVSYSNSVQLYERMFAILREDAKACGFELRLDGLEETVSYKKEQEKQHELSFSSWSITPPTPDFHQFMHSSNAFTEKGNVKTQTNNTFCWGRADTDALCDQVRNARTPEELREAAWKLQRIMHDEAIFFPGFTTDFIRIASWRWVRWPDCETTRFSPSVVYDPHELHLFWIDPNKQRETLDAVRRGRAFPESNRVYDQFRTQPAPAENP